MTDRELEKRIKSSFDHISPDILDSVLSDCNAQKGQVIIMNERKKKNSFVRYIAGLAAALMLIAGGTGAYRANRAIASTIMLDVNPSIEIRVNRAEKVLEVLPLNDDAKTVVGSMDFFGSSLDVTVNALIGSMLRNGYISDVSNSILVSVDSNDPVAAEEMQAKLMTEIDAVLNSGNVSGAVLGQTVTDDGEIQQLAEQYGITSGKAKLIRQITQQNTLYTFADLVPLTINELNLISESGGTKLENIDSIGTASSSGYVGDEAAKEAAFRHAGVDAGKASKVKCELDWEEGMMVYEVDFDAEGLEYEYEINAETGEIVRFEKEKADRKVSASEPGNIGEEEAKKAALDHAGVKESDVLYCSCEPDRERGIAVYDIEFVANGYEYDYDVNAATGEIVKYGREKDDDHSAKKVEKAPKAGEASGDIGEAAAKEAALNHAGVSEVRAYKCERDFEHGKAVYEISFKANGFEYEYEIDVSDGTILKSEKERD